MPNIKAQEKNLKKIAKQREYNRKIKATMLTARKQLSQLLGKSSAEKTTPRATVAKSLSQYQKLVDKAVSKGVLKKNTASRYKSRSASLVAQLASKATTTKPEK